MAEIRKDTPFRGTSEIGENSPNGHDADLAIAHFSVNRTKQTATFGVTLHLEGAEWSVMDTLSRIPGGAFPEEILSNNVAYDGFTPEIDEIVCSLRQKLQSVGINPEVLGRVDVGDRRHFGIDTDLIVAPGIDGIKQPVPPGAFKKEYQPGEDIYLAGDPSADLHLLLNGTVELISEQYPQRSIRRGGYLEERTIETLDAPQVFGEEVLLSEDNYAYSARARSKVTIKHIPKAGIIPYFTAHPQALVTAVHFLLTRIQAGQKRLGNAYFLDEAQKIAWELLRSESNTVEARHEDIARAALTSRASVTIFLKKYKRMGVIRSVRKGMFEITDRERLARLTRLEEELKREA